MERVLVTGAGGHLGANLVRRLLQVGASVRALLYSDRERRSVAELPVETMIGDLRHPDFAAAAVSGCTEVHHCAAVVSTANRHRWELFSCNVLATRVLLAEAQRAGVRKVVVTSSISATGRHTDSGPSDETVPFNPLEHHAPYALTKAAVEHECLKAVVAGLSVVIAVPTAIVGPNDFKPSRFGQVLQRFAAGRLHAYCPGGTSFVTARDIAEGHVLAMAHGSPGEKYIFSSEFKTIDDIMRLCSEVTGRPMPLMRIPPGAMKVLSSGIETVQSLLAPNREPLVTQSEVRILQQYRTVDISKARTQLGFQPTRVDDAIREAFDCFISRGEISLPARRRRCVARHSAPEPST